MGPQQSFSFFQIEENVLAKSTAAQVWAGMALVEGVTKTLSLVQWSPLHRGSSYHYRPIGPSLPLSLFFFDCLPPKRLSRPLCPHNCIFPRSR